MRWTDEGVVLATRRHGERALVVEVLTAGHGRHAGLVRGGQGPKLRVLYQTGSRVALTWSARLADHLGTFAGELLFGHAARFIDDRGRLACLAAAAALTATTLPEREPHPRVYTGMSALLDALDRNEGYAACYVRLELDLLAELGYGLDLSRCAATGTREGLTHVSPKSGQAVSAPAAAPYRERLLPLPHFLLDAAEAPNCAAILAGLKLTGFFLDRRVFHPHGRKMPAARSRFVDVLRRTATLSAERIESA
ncbi:MAG: DNA repair protein RecO [Alphaproteobacteria bacterium]|nr:DNA repair protein RecO [Alphaproteobacteria bacterium]